MQQLDVRMAGSPKSSERGGEAVMVAQAVARKKNRSARSKSSCYLPVFQGADCRC